MGKKKHHPDAEEILSRPWCYYCERDFDDLKILISHQKARHFKCDRCGRRLNTAGGLSVHMTQVHKETLTAVENALPNRSNLDVEIFGMEGIPEDIVAAHNQRLLSQLQQAEAERRAITGNPGPGANAGAGSKKPKFESPAELKKRLAEHKARMAEQAAGGNSGSATPGGASQSAQVQSPGVVQSPGAFQARSPPYVQQPHQYAPPNAATFSSFPQPFDQPAGAFQQNQPGMHQQLPTFPPPGIPQIPPGQHFAVAQPYPAAVSPFPPAYQGVSRPPGATSPPLPFAHNAGLPPRIHTPPQTGAILPRPATLPPAAPGLPQRPSFGAPPVNAFQMQQMHHGQARVPPPQTGAVQPAAAAAAVGADVVPNGNAVNAGQSVVPEPVQPPNPVSVSGMSVEGPGTGKPQPKTPDTAVEKKSKKEREKDRITRLYYSDNEVSPEEKMSRLPRYAFVPLSKDSVTAVTDAVTATSIASNV
ncbi:MAG: hypothetical protein M1825_000749 [Sarcosagium campestre]|nr:MAG: hypothetical protein M1825_000749 [Sarcosagium campestre]